MVPGLAVRCGMFGAALGMVLSLGGCESSARQDPYPKPTAACAFMAPTVSGTRNYAPKGATPNSAIAYPDPETPLYCDRPLSESIRASIELANYRQALETVGLLKLLQKNGPFTVFAIPNAPLEDYSAQVQGGLMLPSNAPALKTILNYTIVRGNWPVTKLKKAIARSPTHAVGLHTIGGALIDLSLDPASGQVVLGNGAGATAKLWVMGVPQSNGTLYFTQSLLLPPPPPASVPASRTLPPRGGVGQSVQPVTTATHAPPLVLPASLRAPN